MFTETYPEVMAAIEAAGLHWQIHDDADEQFGGSLTEYDPRSGETTEYKTHGGSICLTDDDVSELLARYGGGADFPAAICERMKITDEMIEAHRGK